MPTIEVSVTIRKPKDQVYRVVKNMEDFPRFMRDVRHLKIIRRLDENKIVTHWETEIDGAPVKWREEDYFDDTKYQVKFSMLEGDYAQYQGYWLIQDLRRGNTKLTIKADFDWGIPVLENYVGKALEDKARRGLLGMIQAIKNKVERIHV